MTHLEVVPALTEGQREAIRRARFKTCNGERTTAIVYDSDRDLMAATGLSFTAYQRAPISNPGVWDHEARSSDPEVIEFVASLPSHREKA